MTDRVLSVRLQLEVAKARREAKEFANDLRNVGSAAEGAGKGTASLTGLGRAAVSAGKATAAVGAIAVGGMAAMTAATLKGGVAYNTLEQTSRAALTTLTGSASAANSQMAELREFGKTSPFPRQVWISAQQQLLAFGMSAEKVIPTFAAIQDAVAAAGGGGQQITEVVDVLAKVQSTGKVTAETLNELGYRGIDAAALIGEAMGKTAGEVRADITAQAISGTQFIDMLTGAMETRFGGAAANVKATWAGATDRIKGAVRDIGGLLASPFVAPEGGGAAVDWANAIADALRALESRLEPVMAALKDRAGPVFDAITAKLEALAAWIRNVDFHELAGKVKTFLPAIMAAAGGIAAFSGQSLKSIPIIGDLVGGMKPLPVALLAAAAASPELRQALMDLVVAAAPLLTAAAQLTTTLAGALGPALSVVAALLQPIIAVVGFLAERFSELPNLIQMVVVGFVAWKALGIGSWLMQNVTAMRSFGEQMRVQQALAAMSGQQVGAMGAAYSVAATRVSAAGATIAATGARISGALSSAAGFMAGPWGAAIGVGVGLLAMFSTATDDAVTNQEGLADALEAGTGAITEQTREWVINKLTTTGVADTYRKMGGDLNDLVDAYLGVPGAMDKVNAAGDRYRQKIEAGGRAADVSADEMRAFRDVLKSAPGAMDSARAAARAKAGADRDGAAAANESANAANNLASSMYGVGAATDDIATRAQQLQSVLAGLFDSQFALQEASDGFQGKLQSLRSAFAGNDKAATKSANTADKYSDSIKRQQKIVRDTTKQLRDLAEAQKKAEEEAAEAARNARQRALDDLFGKTFNVQATADAFASALAQAGTDIRDSKALGARDLSGVSEGALANRERMRGLVQAAQAAIQAERDQGASKSRISQVTAQLSDQLDQQAASWGLNTAEVKQYSDAVRSFGSLALQDVIVDLSQVRKEYADQRKEIQENSAEQLDNAKSSAASAAASRGAASAASIHTATLEGNSESAIKNRGLMRDLVKGAQDELTQLHLSGAGREELVAKGEELATQLEQEAIQLGFTKEDVAEYTGTIRASAQEIARYPVLNARANVDAAMTTVTNFVNGVNNQMARIQKNVDIGVRTGMEYINTMSGGHMFLAEGGFVSGPGGPREDKIPAMLSNGEYVVNARGTRKNRTLLEVINQGGDVKVPGFATGGYVAPSWLNYLGLPSTGMQESYDAMMRDLAPLMAFASGPLSWAASQVGKPYIWGGVGPAGYDCSGFQSAITNVIQGRSPYSRRFATGGFPTGDFAKGPGNYSIGFFRGNPGHMAGTLLGVNVESRGGEGVVMGKRARGAGDRLFGGNIWHLKGFADGGFVSGDAPFDLVSPLGMHFDELVKGSYASGTDYVPMDGLYQLHRGEKVVPAAQNGPISGEIVVRSDGSKFGDLVVESINKANGTGRIRLVTK